MHIPTRQTWARQKGRKEMYYIGICTMLQNSQKVQIGASHTDCLKGYKPMFFEKKNFTPHSFGATPFKNNFKKR